METSNRVKLSSDLIFTKLLFLCAFCFSVTLVFNIGHDAPKDEYENGQRLILFGISTISLVYLFTKPAIYFDNSNIYVNQIGKKEIVIPLKKVKSFFENPLSISKGTANYEIEFINSSNQFDKLNFAGNYSSSRVKEFKALIKTTYPSCKIM